MKALWVLALLAIGTPAAAADQAQLSCPRDRLSTDQRSGLEAAAQVLAPFSDPRIVALTETLAACGRAHGWSAAAAESARRYHLSNALLGAMRPRLVAAGIDLNVLERALLADAQLIESSRQGVSDELARDMVTRHLALVARMAGDRMDQVADAVGKYMGAVVLAEASRRNFGVE